MEKSVRQFIKENDLIGAGQTVGVAVSGGPDSMALLACLCSMASSFFCSVVCVHFEHGIRGEESRSDADFVADYCAEHKIPFYMSAADVPALAHEWGMGKQSAAKRAREAYFDSLVESGEVDVIATAHHLDDNAESVLMHVLRGSGIDGLVGIHPRLGHTIRPFLCVGREEILAYLKEKGISYVVDRTNAENEYTRNFIRNVLMPQIREKINPEAAAALNRLSVIAESDARYLRKQAEQEFAGHAEVRNEAVRMDREWLLGLPMAVACRVIRIACEKLHVTQDLENIHVVSALDLAKRGRTGAKTNLAHRLYAGVEYDTFCIGIAGREADRSFCQEFDCSADNVLPDGSVITCEEVEKCDFSNADPFCAYLDLEKLPQRLTLRTRWQGDMIHPLGAPGKKKLKDYFIDKKLPREQRDETPLLADGNRILWAVGHVIDDSCRVDEHTKRILCLKYQKKAQEGAG